MDFVTRTLSAYLKTIQSPKASLKSFILVIFEMSKLYLFDFYYSCCFMHAWVIVRWIDKGLSS